MLGSPGDMMGLKALLQEKIRSYVEGHLDQADLRLWLGDHAQEIASSGDAELDDLDGLVWVLVSELDLGHRDEESVRAELAARLSDDINRQTARGAGGAPDRLKPTKRRTAVN